MTKNVYLITLFSLVLTGVYAQQWTKLSTEAYPGKQDDITFIDDQTGCTSMGMVRYIKLKMVEQRGINYLRVKDRSFALLLLQIA